MRGGDLCGRAAEGGECSHDNLLGYLILLHVTFKIFSWSWHVRCIGVKLPVINVD